MGERFNKYFQEIPQNIIQRTAQFLLTGFLFGSGIAMLVSSVIPNFAASNKYFISIYPYTFFFLNQINSILMAFVLIAAGVGTAARVKKAFSLTIIVLVIAILNTLRWLLIYGEFSWSFILFLFCVLLLTWVSRGAYYRERMAPSWGLVSWTIAIYIVTFVTYGIVGVLNRPNTHHNFTVPHFLFFPSQKVWLGGFFGLILAAVILFVFLRYFSKDTHSKIQQALDFNRIGNVIAQFGGNEISHLGFIRDKQMYVYQADGKDQLIFLFRKKADKLIVLGEPFGNQAYLQAGLAQFMDDADREDFTLIFYEASRALTMQLHEWGFDFFKNGEEGFVDLTTFTMNGKKMRGERALVNKFKREGYKFKLLQPPFSPEIMRELHQVSDEWLGKETEKGFSLGYFVPDYLNRAPVAVVYDHKGEIISFASVMPQGNTKIISIDLMRSRKDAPSGIMDFLLVNFFESARTEGYTSFNFGMAPLAGVGISHFSFLEERISHMIYEYGYKLYGFQGLREYKAKYVSKWVPKYIAYRKKRSLIYTVLQVLQVVNSPIHRGHERT